MLFLLLSRKGLILQSSCLLRSDFGKIGGGATLPRHDTKHGKGAIGELDSLEDIRVGHTTHESHVTNSMTNNVVRYSISRLIW